MSLKVWLPLNGNLNNQGASGCNPVQSTAPTYVNGKIGKAMSTGAFYLPASEVAKFYNNNAMSWCFWIYPTGSGGNAILGQQNMAVGNNRMFTIFQYPNSVDLHLSLQGEAQNNATFLQTIISNAFTVNTLNHCAITYNGTTALMYVNGTLIGSATGTSPRTNFSYDVPLPSAGNRYLCDLRIYDHVLSPKEIKEISKGLVLHYPMTGGGRGQDNLYDFQSVVNKWTNEGMASFSNYTDSEYGNVLKMTNSSANVRIYRNVSNVLKSGQSYTVSFLARSATAGAIVNMSRSIADFSSNFTLTTSWKKYVGTINSTATSDGGTLSFRIVSASAEVYLTNIKLENGIVNTPYIPGSSDPNYTTLGYGDNKEYDISGYKYHGTKSGVTYESDSPKYDVSTIFDANADTVTLPAILTSGTTIPQMSVSILFKTNTLNNTAPNLLSLGENSFARIRLASATSMLYYIKVASTNVSSTYTTKTLTDNVLHQVVFTFNNGIVTMYIDGVQIGTTNHSSTGTSLTMSSTSLHLAGYSANSENFLGNLSDFRIYTTALSADDVKELYQTSASIANNGTVMCYEFNEE